MICPLCGHKGNLPGADWCLWCLFDLAAIDRPTPSDRVEKSLMTEAVSALYPREPLTVSVQTTLSEAISEMIRRRVGAVLVANAQGQLVGILTERDFLTKIAGAVSYGKHVVSEFMTRDPESVTPTDPLAYALGKMASGGYRHLPVVSSGIPIGVVSIRDILRHIVELCRDS